MEFGTKKMPERPLFRLVFDMEKDKVTEMIETEFNKELERFLL